LKSLLVGLKEQVSHGVLAQGRQLNVLLLLKVLDEEPVGDGCHDTSTITISCVRAHGTTMGHVAEKVTGITDNLVARLALDVAENMLATIYHSKRTMSIFEAFEATHQAKPTPQASFS
jgi:hypothetical protein